MRSPIFTIPSGSTDSFQDHENDTIEADDGHDEDDLLDFAVSGQNGSILDEALTHVAQRARPGSSSAASTLKPQSTAVVVHRLSTSGEPSMTEEPEEEPRPEEVGSPLAVVDAAAAEETRLKANIRRYYALMELFETEKGYLNDLRVLVEVYLASLGAVTLSPTPCVGVCTVEDAVPSRGRAPSPLYHQLPLQPQHHQPICSLSPIGSYDGFDEPEEEDDAQHRPATPFPEKDALSHVALAVEAEGDAHGLTTGEAGSTLGRRASLAANPKRISPLHPPSAFPSQQLQSSSGVAAVGASVMPQAQVPRSRKRSLSLSLGLKGRGSNDAEEAEQASRSDGVPRVVIGIGEHRRSLSSVSISTHQHQHKRSSSITSTFANPPHTATSTSNTASSHSGPSSSASSSSHTSSSTSHSVTFFMSPSGSTYTPLTSGTPSPATPCIPIPAVSSTNVNAIPAPSLIASEKEILARSASGLLSLHERVFEDMERVLSSLGGVSDSAGVEEAVKAVCGLFVREAPNFTPYASFCAGHTEALDAARRAMRAHVSDWTDWERRCASEACAVLVPTSPATDQPLFSGRLTDEPEANPAEKVQHQQQGLTKLQKLARRSSTLLLGASYHSQQQQVDIVGTVSEAVEASGSSTTLTLRRRHSASASTLSLGGNGGLVASESVASVRGLKHTKSEPKKRESVVSLAARIGAKADGELSGSPSTKRLSRALPSAISVVSYIGGAKEKERQATMKLMFSDYLIKPVQRVCKYPLLLEQLRGPVPTEDETDRIITHALRSMKDVALAVDEARRRRDVEIKSKLIVDRLVAGNPSSGSSSHCDTPITRNSTFGSDVEMEHPTVQTSRSQSSLKAQPSRALSLSSAFTRSRSRLNINQQQQQQPESSPASHARSRSWQLSQSQQNMSDSLQSSAPSGHSGFVPGAPSRAFLTSLGACLLAGTLDVAVSDQEGVSSSKNRRDSRRDSTFSTSSARSVRGGRTSPLVSTMRVQEVDELDDAGSAFVQAPPMPMPQQQQQQSNRDPVKVKYLVAFLYVGGYMVMAKPVKAGVYAARHWFSLAEDLVDVVDLCDDEALLPCSLQLHFRSTGHRLELAAACQREKYLWLDAIQSARTVKPTWEYEPLPTLSLSTTFVSSRTRTSIDLQPPPPVPAIPAVPSAVTFMQDEDDPRQAKPSRKASTSTVRTEATVKQQRVTPNKRASVTGTTVRAFFLNNGPLAYGLSEANGTGPSTVLLRRASATRRAQADRILADVLSEPLLEARIHAKAHDEVLFRDPDPPQNSTLGMSAIAKNKLMNRESILVSKQCPPFPLSFVQPEEQRPTVVVPEQTLEMNRRPSIMSRALSMGRRRATPRKGRAVHLTLTTSKAELHDEGMYSQASSLCSPVSPDSPLPCPSHYPGPLSRSQCSSVSTNAGPSPFDPQFPPEVRVVGIDSPPRLHGDDLPDMLEQDSRPKRSRSLVDNVKGFFFIPRSTSPSPSSSSSRQTSAEGLAHPHSEIVGKQRPSILTRVFRSASNIHRQDSSSESPGDDENPRRLRLVHSSTTPSFASSSLHPDSARHQEIPIKRSTSNLLTPMSAEFVHINSSDVPDATRDKRKSIGRHIKRRFFPSTLTPLTPAPLQHAV